MRTLRLAAAAALALPLFAVSANAQAPSMADLHAKAKAEGQVIFGGAIKESAATELSRAFSKRYPGVRVNYTRRSTEPMVQLIEAERLAGKVSFDVLNVTEPGDALRWKKEGFLAKVAVPEVAGKMMRDSFDADGTYYSLGVTPMYGIYNTKTFTKATAPKSLKTLVNDPQFVGKIAISRPIRGGTSASALLNVANVVGAPEILKKAPSLKILLTRGNEAALDAVARGERPVSWGISGYRALEAKAEGQPIELIYWEEGVPLAHFLGCVPAKAPNPNAAQLLLRWLLSDEGQAIIVKEGNFYSPRTDFAQTPAGEPPLSKVKTANITFERVVGEAQQLAKDFDKAVGLK